MKNNIKLEKEIVVIVEGNDDLRLIQDLLKGINKSEKIQCINTVGKGKIPIILQNLKKDSNIYNLKTLAIIIDADRNPEQASKDVEKFIKKSKLPKSIDCKTLIVPQYGKGMLEDICMESVEDESIMLCVNNFLECIEPHVEELPRNPSKSRFLAYMASRPKATNGTIEAALQKNYFNLTHSAFDDIRSFLENINK